MPIINWIRRKWRSYNPSTTVHDLLRVLDIQATSDHVDKILREHPDYPSILSLAESLPEWGVRAEGVKGTIDDITETDYSSIVHIKKSEMGQDFAVLEAIDDRRVSIIRSSAGCEVINLDDFVKLWSGVLLRAIPEEHAGEPDFKTHRKTQRQNRIRRLLPVVGLPALFLLAFGFGLVQVGSMGTLIPLGLAKALGFVLCIVMVAAALGEGSMMNSLCPMGKVANCHRVMLSPAGRLFGVSMAELGMLYYCGGLLSLLGAFFLGHFQSDIFLIGVLGLLALPYTIFSVIYQAFVVRSLCWMCLVIQILFWVEFYLLYESTIPHFREGLQAIEFPLSLLLGFGVSTLTWISLRHTITSAKKTEDYETQITRLRSQPDFIRTQLDKTEATDMGQPPFEVEVGPMDAAIVMTMVVNPLCGHCWKVFNQMDQIIKVGRGQIKARIRFLVKGEDKTKSDTEKMLDREVSLRILTMAELEDREQVHRALRTWFAEDDRFSKGKYDRWVAECPVADGNAIAEVAAVLDQHREWALRNNILGTPALFFGDRQLHSGLQLSDLKIFIMRQLED